MTIRLPDQRDWPEPVTKLGFFYLPAAAFLINEVLIDEHKPTSSEFLILLLLMVISAKESTFKLEISVPTRVLASRANMSQRQVFRILKALEQKHFIHRMKKRTRGTNRRTSGYAIHGLIRALSLVSNRAKPAS